MTLATSRYDSPQEQRRFASGTRTGTRTAANFTINLGFKPKRIRVINLSDRIQAEHFVDAALDGASNAKSILTVAAGTRTYAAAGIALTADGLGFTVTVATAALETDNDDVYWEAEA